MNFRLIVTVERFTPRGTPYRHTIWMGEFDPTETTLEEAFNEASSCARETHGSGFIVSPEDLPSIFH